MFGAWAVLGDTLEVVLSEVAELALAIAVGLGTFHSEQRNNSGARYVLGRNVYRAPTRIRGARVQRR